MNFRDYIRDRIVSSQDRILEFGPLNWPIVTKDKFPNTFYSDIRDSAEIKTLYTSNDYLSSTGIKIDVDTIVDIDYVVKGTYKEAFKGVERFDAVILGHVIEHIPDIIAFFLDVVNVVKADGKLILIYPDARYCFDSFRNGTTFIDAYDVFKDNTNSSKRVFDFVFNVLHENDPNIFWNDKSQNNLLPKNSFQKAIEAYEKAKKNVLPDDTHFWPFADYQFIKFLYDMDRAGFLEFDIDEFYPTQNNTQEFMVILTPKKKKSIKVDRYRKALDKTSPVLQQINARIRDEELQEQISDLTSINSKLALENGTLKKELKSIYRSKKWRIASSVASAKAKLIGINKGE